MTTHAATADSSERHQLLHPDIDTAHLQTLVDVLSLERKIELLTGKDFWSTVPLDEIGLRSMVMSDGPAGVRGEVWDERSPSLSLPSGTALASSWDEDVARDYGRVMAQEARRKGVDIVLGPTINLHRSPLGGRHFEAFSEDPLLTARLAAAYVDGMQSQGVAATPKHFVANDWETDRMSASSDVGERSLRELYLAAFEKAVVESRSWALMSAYNAVNGTASSESDLLTDPLITEWDFDGVIVSDWGGVYRLESAKSPQTLAMPGPASVWGGALVEAVRNGDVSEIVIDEKVRRLLRLAARVGALRGHEPKPVGSLIDGPTFAHRAAVEGSVLLSNDGLLPMSQASLRRVAVIGQSAELARTQGGGSATVLTTPVVSPVSALRSALPGVRVDYSIGAVLEEGIVPLPLAEMTNPSTGEPGALVRFLDDTGVEISREDRFATDLFYFGGTAPTGTAAQFELTFRWSPRAESSTELSYSVGASSTLWIDGVQSANTSIGGLTFEESLQAPPEASAPVEAGSRHEIRILVDLAHRPVTDAAAALFAIRVGTRIVDIAPEALIAEAVESAREADAAVVVVGTSASFESEGWDRTTLGLPGAQDQLVEAVLDTGVPTIVIVNSGAPVVLPWRKRAAAILLTYFGGQEMGPALAEMLLGIAEPGGRLTTTWGAREEDFPILDTTPTEGHVRYDEGISIGYRAWLRADQAVPAWYFGHGLGYTSWDLGFGGLPDHLDPGESNEVVVTVQNTGTRAGKQVVQLYVSARPDEQWPVDRPTRWLVGSAVVRLDAGARADVHVAIDRRAFTVWMPEGWRDLPGGYDLHVGTSVVDILESRSITVG